MSGTQIPAPQSLFSEALVRRRGTAALPTTWPISLGKVLPANLGPTTGLQALQLSVWFSLNILWCCDMASSRGLLKANKILGSG